MLEEHKLHLRMVLERFQLYGILINPTKCVLDVGELQFLGQHVNQHRVSLPEDQVQVIREFPKPTTVVMSTTGELGYQNTANYVCK